MRSSVYIFSFFLTAQRTNSNLFDVFQTFDQLNIDTDSLLEYHNNVHVPPSSVSLPPSLPLPSVQRHVHTGNNKYIFRGSIKRSEGNIVGEEGSAGEEREEEEEEEEEWEEIPGHLPPLPLMNTKEEGMEGNYYKFDKCLRDRRKREMRKMRLII